MTFQVQARSQQELDLIHFTFSSQSVSHRFDQMFIPTARQIARDCVVLLQNHSNLLPLSKGTNVSLIGAFAKDHPRFQGMGSSQVNATHILNAFDEMKAFTNQVHYAPGYAVDGPFHVIDNALLDEAVRVARKGDVVVLVRTVDPCEASASFP